MSEFPADIMKDAEEAVAGFMDWVKGGNTTAILSEHAESGLKHSFASAILAERERCAKIAKPAKRPCDCERCDCSNHATSEAVVAWEVSNLIFQAITKDCGA